MKILYLTPNFEKYTSAIYQVNSYKYLYKFSEVILWGPGFNNYDESLSLEKLVNKFNLTKNDVVCVGHGWLSDINFKNISKKNIKARYKWLNSSKYKLELDQLEFCRKYDFNQFNGKKICILNKEYISLDEKLNFIKKNNFDLALSMNPHYKIYENKIGIKFKFWPCAVDHLKYIDFDYNIKKKFDLCFSGLIKNFNVSNNQTKNLRTDILKELFYNIGYVRIFKKKEYDSLNIFWNSYTGNKYMDFLSKFFFQYKYINEENYPKLLANSKVIINTLGPSDIIGPRYFESMLAKSICFAEKSDLYNDVFKENIHYVSYEKDLSDFNEKLKFALSDSEEINKIRNCAYDHVLKNHTYVKRAEELTNWSKSIKK